MTLTGGEIFAGYTIVRQLGRGGMGEVYLAKHPRLPRQEALKILLPDISNDETFQQRFIREADSIAALEHPNIVTVHDRGETDGRLWIATQYVDGTDAAKLLRDRYPAGMPADEVAEITTAIAAALDHAHARGLLHRDVKPANILLAHPDQDGRRRIYLADFGIARPLDDPSGLTSTNFTIGTFAYSAPEQLVGKETDGRADQYALAATAYHLLTGATLYPDSNPVAVIGRHLTEPPPLPSTIRTDFAPLDAAFKRALSKDPGDRFSSCRDFARAMSAVVAQSDVGYSPSAPTQEAQAPRTPSKATKPSRPLRGTHLPAAAATLGLVALGALFWHPWANKESGIPVSPPTSAAPNAESLVTASTTPSASPTPTTSTPPSTVSASQVPASPTPSSQAPRPAPRAQAAPEAGDKCYEMDATTQDASGEPMRCNPLGHGAIWQYGPSPTMYTPPPSERNPAGPQPGTPCSVPGVVLPGPMGLVDCQFRNWGPMGIGYFWGYAMTSN